MRRERRESAVAAVEVEPVDRDAELLAGVAHEQLRSAVGRQRRGELGARRPAEPRHGSLAARRPTRSAARGSAGTAARPAPPRRSSTCPAASRAVALRIASPRGSTAATISPGWSSGAARGVTRTVRPLPSTTSSRCVASGTKPVSVLGIPAAPDLAPERHDRLPAPARDRRVLIAREDPHGQAQLLAAVLGRQRDRLEPRCHDRFDPHERAAGATPQDLVPRVRCPGSWRRR